MYRNLLLFTFLLFISTNLFSQVWKGRVVNAETDAPIPYANVFLRGSLMGTISDTEGCFELDCKGNTVLSLVVSSMGFEMLIVNPEMINSNLKVGLTERSYEIDEIAVNAEPSGWSRRKMLRKFKAEFVGSTRIAKSCQILNIDEVYLYYNNHTKTLHGRCKTPIVIRNKALGYQLSFVLDEFVWSSDRMIYKGVSSFEELTFLDKNEIKKIDSRRYLAYRGTPMNFFRCVYRGDLNGSRFSIYDKNDAALDVKDIISKINNQSKLCRNGVLNVHYAGTAKTQIILHEGCIALNAIGVFDPELVSFTGWMGVYRVGDMLPYDYIPIQ